MNEDNILVSVKASLGLPANYAPFDAEIIMDINTVLGIVNQLGIGVDGYEIDDEHPGSWDDFLAGEITSGISMNEVKTYVVKRVQMLFDPPTSGILMDAMKENLRELEWRIYVKRETPPVPVEETK